MSVSSARITAKKAPHAFDDGNSYGSISNDQHRTAVTKDPYDAGPAGERFFDAPDDILPEWEMTVVRLKYGSCIVGFATFMVMFTMCLDMSWWRNWGVAWIQWAQSDLSEAGGHAWTSLTYFGEDVPEFIAIVIYMSWDYGVGMRVCILLSQVIYCNAVLKTAFHDCRPYWYTTEVDIIAVCTRTWGFPATHASITASFYPLIAWEMYHLLFSRRATTPGRRRLSYDLRETWQLGLVYLALFLIILMVGLSRSVLGTHFPYQVIVGWLMGFTILQVYLQYSPHIKDAGGANTARRLDMIRNSHAMNIVVGPVFFAIVPIIVYHMVASSWMPPEVWNTNAHITCTQEDFGMDRSSAFIEAICGATMYGMLCAISYWRDTFFPFNTNQGSFGARFARGLVGMFMVCVRSVFIKAAQGIVGVPPKAVGMTFAIVVGNLCMFALGPVLSMQCCLMDRPLVAGSSRDDAGESDAILTTDGGGYDYRNSRNGESPELHQHSNFGHMSGRSEQLSPGIGGGIRPPATQL